MSRIAVRVRIEGRVQGVGYRWWTVERAREGHLSGWVRNRTDETVEALFCGSAEAVAEMIAACEKGPPLARVTLVRQSPAEPPDESGFRQLPTA